MQMEATCVSHSGVFKDCTGNTSSPWVEEKQNAVKPGGAEYLSNEKTLSRDVQYVGNVT